MSNRPTNFDVVESLEVVWDALHTYEECVLDVIGKREYATDLRETAATQFDEERAAAAEEDADFYDKQWSDITTAMAWITEALGLEISTRDDETNGEYVERVEE